MKTEDSLANWEKWPVAALFVASGLYIAEWYAGVRLALPAWLMAWISTGGGLAAMLAVDGAMIATVAGMRAGRRGWWSYAAILVTAAFGGAVALVLHGALPSMVGAWLHAGFVLTIAAYLLHLAQPRAASANLPQDLADARAELATVREQLAAERARPVVLRVEDAARLLVKAGAPESTIRTWVESGRLRLLEGEEGK
jgi:hypothetical protein